MRLARGGKRRSNLARSRALVDLEHANIVHALYLSASDAGEPILHAERVRFLKGLRFKGLGFRGTGRAREMEDDMRARGKQLGKNG